MPKKITTKAAWIKLGFDQFCKGGSEALKIEAMARTLKVSKASFYHFFKNRDVFIIDIIEYWQELRTNEFIEFSKAKSDSALMIETLILAIFGEKIEDDFVFHLRRLGVINENAGNMLRYIEKQRVGFAAMAIEELGFTLEEAEQKANIIYNYYLGWRERQKSALSEPVNPSSELALIIKHLELFKFKETAHPP